MSDDKATAKLGLYVHWPYCARICPYCDFNVRRDRGQDTDFLVNAIVDDIQGWATRIDQPKPLSAISFGGGTPSRMHPAQIGRITQAAEKNFGFATDIEISLEANPTDYEMRRYGDFAALGVNRLSLGMQSLEAKELHFLGRDHSVTEAKAALDTAQHKFKRISADFIYGLPDQSQNNWQQQLQEILKLGVDHLSLYCLSIEPGTAFFKNQTDGVLLACEDDLVADLYAITDLLTGAAGLLAYETSNYSRDQQNQSIHNLIYWQGDDWVGVGPGAHGRALIAGKRHEVTTHKRPQNYAKAVSKTGWGAALNQPLSAIDDLAERLLLGLRLREGIDLAQMQARAGASLNAAALSALIDSGLLVISGGKLQATAPLLVDRIGSELLL